MAECRSCGQNLPAGLCHACLRDFPPETTSPDPRYCPGCYDFLKAEAELLPPLKRPGWIPKPQNGGKKTIPIPQHMVLIMSTLTGKNSEVDIISPPVLKVTHEKRGPKFTELPDDLIRQLAGQGMGSKVIAARLRDDGIKVSYKTIQRRLQGVLV